MTRLFPEDSAERKTYPVFSGFVQYFPSAMAEIARHSYLGNQKHNAGQPLHHDRSKSDDEADAQLRHLMEGDYVGMGWRAMALLQKHLEANGAPIAPGARNATPLPGSLDALRIERNTPPTVLAAQDAIGSRDSDDNTDGLLAGSAP